MYYTLGNKDLATEEMYSVLDQWRRYAPPQVGNRWGTPTLLP